LAALDLLRSQPQRVDKLQRNARVLREALAEEGLDSGDSETQIVPLVVGGAAEAMAACEKALARGVFAQAIRPPTVPDGTSRLRLAVMASHTGAELRQAAKALAAAVPAQPALPGRQGEPGPGVYDGLAEAA
jgi:glycine C-acetyltransferase/8-amino-7-oxononanoate synthase